MAYDSTNTGVLFINKDRKSEKHPNFEGRINVNGTDYDIVGWTKVSKAGDKFISIAVKQPREKPKPAEPVKEPEPQTVTIDEIPDSIPF